MSLALQSLGAQHRPGVLQKVQRGVGEGRVDLPAKLGSVPAPNPLDISPREPRQEMASAGVMQS